MVLDSQDLMHHRLVGPLVEKGRGRVVTAIQDQQNWGDVGTEREELMLSANSTL